MIPRLLSIYIAKRFSITVAIILAMLGVIAFMVDYLDALRRLADEEGVSALVALRLSGMRVPIVLEAMFPFVFLFGAVISLIDISRNSELVVARASGVSVWGLLRGPVAVTVAFGIVATAILNPLTVALKDRATILEAELLGQAPRNTGHWFRQEGGDGQSIVHTGSASRDGRTLFGVTAFVFDAEGQFLEKAVAPRAEFSDDHWVLTDATVLSAASRRHSVGNYQLPTRLSPGRLQRSFLEPEAISVWSLPDFIETARRIGLNADRFRVAFHTLLNRPLMLVAMLLIAATVSLRLTRYGGTWRLVLTGAGLGFLLYAANEIVSDFGANGILHPVLAAWLPPIVALTFGATVLLYKEDG